ncbi:GlxA family transcriptional regulator [Nocardia thailandica]|uniref:GlxA family transcriptional regulator n=1 Tax=Nocardia thailandica TaxID=257275 RepID=UPI0003144C47|nr:helix-turn-helix domain-containing protein [Nocardia thailandica]
MERRVAVVAYDGAEMLDIAGITGPLDAANRFGADPPYRFQLLTRGGRTITCDNGFRLEGQGALERARGPFDTLVVAGGLGHAEAAADPRLLAHVRRLGRDSRRVASVCTGAGILAAAGMLDGQRATTHWIYADRLAAEHPRVAVDPRPVFIRGEHVSTAAGVTSGIDLMLDFVAEDHGPALARDAARGLVTYLQRPGNQAQMSMFTRREPVGHNALRAATDHVAAHFAERLSTAGLAAVAGVGERQLTRLFAEHLGTSPARYVRTVRLEAAAHLLETGDLALERVAADCGFASAETLRQAFTAAYGVAPSRFRAGARRR